MVPAPSHNKSPLKMSENAHWMLDYVRERPQMSPKQTRFISEYLIDLNATKAAERAGYSPKSAYSQGQRLLKNVELSAKIAARQHILVTRNAISADNVLKELAKVAFFDGRELSGPDGSSPPIPSAGDQKQSFGLLKKIKVADKLRALELLGKHLKLFTDVVEVDNKRDYEVQDVKQKLLARLNLAKLNSRTTQRPS